MKNKSRVIRVFLSSTFRDFGEERDLLVKKVFPELRRLCRQRQVELVDVDLRWGITVEEAEQGKVLPICLAEIDRARPYFMGFIGERYGWVPEESEYPEVVVEREPWLKEHQGGKSVTELEMLHGVLNNPEMAGRAFFYFRDKDYSLSKGGDYEPESPQHAAKLDQLRDRLRQSEFPVVEDYPSPESLAERVREDLLKVIEDEYPEEEVPDALTLERMRHEAYGTARRRLYLGGDKHLKALDEAVTREGEQSRPVLVTGGPGVGKSAMLANWVERYAANHPDTHLLVHHTSASAHAADPLRMVRRLIHEITAVTGDSLEPETDADKLLEQVPTVLAMASAHAIRGGKKSGKKGGGQWLIVLDGLDKLTSHGELRWFPRMVPEGVKLVGSCAKEETAGRLRDMLEWEELEIGLFSQKRSREFIGTYLGRFRKTLPADLEDRAMTHPLATNPLWLLTLLEELRLFGKHEEVEERLETLLSDPPGKAEGEEPHIDDLFEHVLARIEEDIDEDYEVEAFKALWASYDGLTRDELLDLTGMPPAKWSEIQNALDENLFEASGQISFSNGFIRKAVGDRHLPTREEQQATHRRLGEWFEGRETSLNVAQERVHQWRQAEDKDKLRECLLGQDVFKLLCDEDKYALLACWLELGEDVSEAYEGVFEQWQDKDEVAFELAGFLSIAGPCGDFVIQLYRQAITEKEKELGPEHPVTLSAVHILGELLLSDKCIKRNPNDAELLCQRALAGREKELGAGHFNTLQSFSALLNVLRYKQTGKYESDRMTRKEYRVKYAHLNVKALAAWKSALASRTPEVWSIVYNFLWEVRMYNMLQSCTKIIDSVEFPHLDDLKQYLAKIDEEYLLRKALTICEENYGERHEKTLNIVKFLGEYISRNFRLKDYSIETADEVIDLFSRVEHGYEINYGKRHPTTLREMHHLAHQYVMLKNHSQAEILARRVLERRREVLGLEHTDTLESQLMLGALLQQREEYKEAEILYQDALSKKEKILGVRHLSTLEIVRTLGRLLEDKGDYVEAEIMYRRALEGGEEELVVDHSFTQEIVNNLARLSVKKEDYKAAELFYRRDLASKEKALGPEHSRTLGRVNNLGIFLNEQNSRTEAIKLLRSYASHSAEAEDTLAYNLACYECLEGNTEEAKRLITAHLKKHPEKKKSALADEDFTAIHDFIKTITTPTDTP